MKKIIILLISGMVWADDFLVYGGPGTQQNPGISWNSNASLYLDVWENYYNGNIEAQRLRKESPHLVGSMITVSTSGDNLKVPDVASDGTRWLAVYEYYDGTPRYAIYSRIINSDGTLGTESNVSGFGGNDARKYNPRVAWNSGSGKYLVVWKETSDGDIDGRLVNPDGTLPGVVISDIISSTQEYGYPAVGSNGTNFLVTAWNYSTYNVDGRIVSGAGVPQGSIFTIGYGGWYGNSDVASNGINFLVVWTDGSSIKGRIYDNNGNPVTNEFTIATGTYMGNPRVDWWEAKSKYQVVWQEYRNPYYFIYGRLVNADGTITDPVIKMTTGNTANQVYPDIACGDTNVTTWQDYRNGNYDIYANLGGVTGEMEQPPPNKNNDQYILPVLFPLPSFLNDELRIKFNGFSKEPLEIFLYNLSGSVTVKKYYPFTYSITLTKEIKDLEKGIYFLRVKSGKRETGFFKLIKSY